MTRAAIIAERIQSLKDEIAVCQLIAVSKYAPIEDIVSAYQAEQFDFGESKVSVLKTKADYFQTQMLKKVRWHFIGHLQTNKVKELLKIPNLHAIHSVDSIRLLQDILKYQTLFQGNELGIFFQVNTSHEEEKSGFETLDELEQALTLLLKEKSSLKFLGLMTMGTMRTDNFEAEAERCFSELRELKRKLQIKYSLSEIKLSMGMSQDYKIAVIAESDFIRIGTAIFKE
jgi:pyridoxal phosphate enzyme (YggS family)